MENLGQVFWAMLWFFMFFIWIWLLIVVFGDIFRCRGSGASTRLTGGHRKLCTRLVSFRYARREALVTLTDCRS